MRVARERLRNLLRGLRLLLPLIRGPRHKDPSLASNSIG